MAITFNGNDIISSTNTAYATCSTAAATAAKVATVQGNDNWQLKSGSIIVVSSTNTNTAQNPTLNVNETGAKSVYYASSTITTSNLNKAGCAGRPILYMYNGTYYVFLGWAYEQDTTYSAATQSSQGLMSVGDKTKLDSIESGANKYSHPTTSGNKHIPSGGSSGQILRWSADGTAVWGADNNTTYTLGSFGITATSTELNYCDGVTSAIQTQLNGKAPTNHASTATTYGIGTASNYGHIKLSDTYSSKVTNGAAANGIAASQNALYNLRSHIFTNTILHNIVDAEFVVDNISIEPNAVATIKFENTQRNDGYSRCIMSVRLENATKNGAQSSACNIYNEQQGTTGQSYSTCLVRNMHASTKAVIRATARIIYVYDCGAGSFSSYFTPS